MRYRFGADFFFQRPLCQDETVVQPRILCGLVHVQLDVQTISTKDRGCNRLATYPGYVIRVS